MSYDSDFESVYMVEFTSGKTIHVGQFTVEDVIEYCADKYKNQVIKTIYKEVYVAEHEEDCPATDGFGCHCGESL
jgi:hypothetical protein